MRTICALWCYYKRENKRRKEADMKDRIIEMLVTLAHISRQMENLSQELDKMYDIIADEKFLETLETKNEK